MDTNIGETRVLISKRAELYNDENTVVYCLVFERLMPQSDRLILAVTKDVFDKYEVLDKVFIQRTLEKVS